MAVGDEPPEHGEQQPGEHEAGEEGEEGVAPLEVQDGGEHVLVEAELLTLSLSYHYH